MAFWEVGFCAYGSSRLGVYLRFLPRESCLFYLLNGLGDVGAGDKVCEDGGRGWGGLEVWGVEGWVVQ